MRSHASDNYDELEKQSISTKTDRTTTLPDSPQITSKAAALIHCKIMLLFPSFLETDSMTINASGLFSKDAFKGKVIGITAGGHGIGKATALLLGELGASVMVMDIDPDFVAQVEKELLDNGVDALCMVTDVGKLDDLTKAVDALKKRWGTLYGWMNNAGINSTARIEDQAESEFTRIWEVNTLAGWRCLKLTLPLFEKTGGAILNVSSILSSRTRPGNLAYTSSKAGLEGLTRGMAIELADRKIRVNCVIPGSVHVQTKTHELKQDAPQSELKKLEAEYFELGAQISQPWRPGRGPEDVANMAVFMLSQAAPYVTGTSIMVDGALNAELRMGYEYSTEQLQTHLSPLIHMRERRHELVSEQDAREKAAQKKTQA